MTSGHSVPELSGDIGIVTAFFDIGRSNWTADKGFPAHVHRTTDTYVERFRILASLENEMVIYTSIDLAPRVAAYRKGKEDRTTIIPMNLDEIFPGKREEIARIQKDPAFIARLNPSQARNPEYCSPDYVLVTNMKAVFVAHAVQNNLVRSRQVAWMDFGYCRDASALGGSRKWQYDFTPGKIHLFVFAHFKGEVSISEIVTSNIVFVAGAAVVAERELWAPFAQLTRTAADELLKHGLVDDDQGLFLMASLYRPDLFEQHLIPDQDWQPVLRLFNRNAADGY